MAVKNSPGGSYFPYYYKGGELYCLHLGSYFSNEAAAIAMLKAEQEFLKSERRRIGVWMDFYETKLTDKVIKEFVATLNDLHDQITKLGLVGCPLIARWKINRLIRSSASLSSLPVRYFDDPEDAKTWLVGKLK